MSVVNTTNTNVHLSIICPYHYRVLYPFVDHQRNLGGYHNLAGSSSMACAGMAAVHSEVTIFMLRSLGRFHPNRVSEEFPALDRVL